MFVLMPPINPTPCPYLRVMWIRTLGHMDGGNRWRGYPFEGYHDTCWPTGLCSTQAKLEGMLKAAWHWGSDNSVVNDPLGEPGCTPLYVGLPSTWGSVEGDRTFSPHFVGGFQKWSISVCGSSVR